MSEWGKLLRRCLLPELFYALRKIFGWGCHYQEREFKLRNVQLLRQRTRWSPDKRTLDGNGGLIRLNLCVKCVWNVGTSLTFSDFTSILFFQLFHKPPIVKLCKAVKIFRFRSYNPPFNSAVTPCQFFKFYFSGNVFFFRESTLSTKHSGTEHFLSSSNQRSRFVHFQLLLKTVFGRFTGGKRN